MYLLLDSEDQVGRCLPQCKCMMLKLFSFLVFLFNVRAKKHFLVFQVHDTYLHSHDKSSCEFKSIGALVY